MRWPRWMRRPEPDPAAWAPPDRLPDGDTIPVPGYPTLYGQMQHPHHPNRATVAPYSGPLANLPPMWRPAP